MSFNWAVLPFWGFFGITGFLVGDTTGCLIGLAGAMFVSFLASMLPDS